MVGDQALDDLVQDGFDQLSRLTAGQSDLLADCLAQLCPRPGVTGHNPPPPMAHFIDLTLTYAQPSVNTTLGRIRAGFRVARGENSTALGIRPACGLPADQRAAPGKTAPHGF